MPSLTILLLSVLWSFQPVENKGDLESLTGLMTGHFSSEAQSQQDSAYYNISLIMHLIWEGDKKVRWLYVEQAVAAMKDKPYRQRVYRISKGKKGSFESRVYELPDPDSYIQAWQTPERFADLKPDQLILREGCSVYLKLQDSGCYEGSTKAKECASTLRGATYATSIVEVCEGQITSWDQGWDASNEQVWGAVDGPYRFDRINE